MCDNKSTKEPQEPSAKSKPPASPEQVSKLPTYPITEDTLAFILRKSPVAARKSRLPCQINWHHGICGNPAESQSPHASL